MIIEQCKQDHFKLLQYSKAKFDLLVPPLAFTVAYTWAVEAWNKGIRLPTHCFNYQMYKIKSWS